MKRDKLYTVGGNIQAKKLYDDGGMLPMPAGYQLGNIQAPGFQIAQGQPLSTGTIGKVNNYFKEQTITGNFGNTALGIVGSLAPMATGLISDGYSTGGVGEGISAAGNAIGSAIPGPWGTVVKAGTSILGGLVNRGWGVKENKQNIAAVKENIATARSTGNNLGNASTNEGVLNAAGNMTGSLGFSASDLYKNGWFTKKGTKKGNALNSQESAALAYQNNALMTGASNADYNMDSGVMRNFAAFGGPLDSMGTIGLLGDMGDMPVLSYDLMTRDLTRKEKQAEAKDKMGGISPANAFCKGGRMFHGGGCLPTMFSLGGDIQNHGADWSTGMTHINAGGSHELNPNEGVQVGVDAEGTPNLVEEGETIYNDYVYSNRITLDDEAKKAFHIGKKRDITYADMSKKLEKEAAERPNDPISKAALKVQLQELAEHQERQKQEMEAERAREAFEALSPEEQTAVMQQVAQQEQAAQEQAMQEEAMAQQQAQGQQMQMSPEEAAMMQQQQMQGQPMMGQPEVVQGQPMMAYGGKLYGEGGNLYPDGGKMRERIYKALGFHTDEDFLKWARKNKLGGDDKWNASENMLKALASDDEAWRTLIKDQTFLDAIKDNPALVNAIKNGYDFGAYTPSTTGNVTFKDISKGNWTAQDYEGWKNSQDPAWLEAVKKGLVKEGMKQEDIAKALKQTDNYKKGTKWLQDSEDNRLRYLKTILEDDYSPEIAKNYARKFIDANGWKQDVARDYASIFGADGKGVRETHPGTYWHTPIEAIRGNQTKNFVIDRAGNIEAIVGDVPTDWTSVGNYSWATPENDITYNYYRKPGNVFHRVEGHTDYLDGTPDTWNGVGKETRRETLPNGDVVIYHADANGNGAEDAGNGNRKVVPNLRSEWPRYAGLFGPAIGLGMQALGIGRPNTKAFDGVIDAYDKTGASFADYKPIGNYLAYNPLDTWAGQNRLNANARATDRAIMNSGATQGSKVAGLLANEYNNQIGSGNLFRQSQEYNDNLRKQVAEFNRGTDQFNAQAYNQLAQFNASQRDRDRQVRAQLGMQAAAQKADMDAGWYNSIYGNVAGLFKGISDLGRENAERNMLARLAASGALGTIKPGSAVDAGLLKYADEAAEGGKIKRKKNKRRGLTI